MIARFQNPADRSRIYRSGWLIVVLALVSYVLVAIAEQGSAGAGLQVVPNEPLPFNRLQGVGVDLSSRSSIEALEWLEQAGTGATPLTIVPVDGDIVAAFNDPETFADARTATTLLVEAAGETRIALCLRRPISATEESVLAEAVVTALIEEFTDRVTYISTCPGESSTTWQSSVLDLIAPGMSAGESEHILAPVSVGEPVRLVPAVAPGDVDDAYLDGLSSTIYTAVTLADQPPLTTDLQIEMRDVLYNRAHIAIVLAVPAETASPQEFIASTVFPPDSRVELAEGFNSAVSPLMHWEGPWTLTDVGPVTYQRSVEAGSRLTAEFVGTEVWALGLVSPQAGSIGVWIDANDAQLREQPDRVVDLSRNQARDTSFLLADDLPAARHTITVVTADGDVALSGLFVTGRPEAGWHGGIGALGIIGIAVCGLAAVISVAINDLRLRIGLDRTDEEESEHPRVFRRDI